MFFSINMSSFSEIRCCDVIMMFSCCINKFFVVSVLKPVYTNVKTLNSCTNL